MTHYGGGRGYRVGYFLGLMSENCPKTFSLTSHSSYVPTPLDPNRADGFKITPDFASLKEVLAALGTGNIPPPVTETNRIRIDRIFYKARAHNNVTKIDYNPPLNMGDPDFPNTHREIQGHATYFMTAEDVTEPIVVDGVTRASRVLQRNLQSKIRVSVTAAVVAFDRFVGSGFQNNTSTARATWEKTVNIGVMPTLFKYGTEKQVTFDLTPADLHPSFPPTVTKQFGSNPPGTEYFRDEIFAQADSAKAFFEGASFDVAIAFGATPRLLGNYTAMAYAPSDPSH